MLTKKACAALGGVRYNRLERSDDPLVEVENLFFRNRMSDDFQRPVPSSSPLFLCIYEAKLQIMFVYDGYWLKNRHFKCFFQVDTTWYDEI